LASLKRSTERITGLGRILRDHGWDELPQIANILLGQMSFIGPRPLSKYSLERFQKAYPNKARKIDKWLTERQKVLPGLSGWHQIHLPDHNIIKYDLEYLGDPSLKKKLKIVLVSVAILVVGKSAFFGQKIPDMYEYEIS
jgi:putative colanic acid biosynthesis UDP-glucose lipid carrier transferase